MPYIWLGLLVYFGIEDNPTSLISVTIIFFVITPIVDEFVSWLDNQLRNVFNFGELG